MRLHYGEVVWIKPKRGAISQWAKAEFREMLRKRGAYIPEGATDEEYRAPADEFLRLTERGSRGA